MSYLTCLKCRFSLIIWFVFVLCMLIWKLLIWSQETQSTRIKNIRGHSICHGSLGKISLYWGKCSSTWRKSSLISLNVLYIFFFNNADIKYINLTSRNGKRHYWRILIVFLIHMGKKIINTNKVYVFLYLKVDYYLLVIERWVTCIYFKLIITVSRLLR